MRRTTILGLALSLAMGCYDEPVSPSARKATPSASLTQVASFPACTKHWKNSVSGIWSFGVNWTPAGVPGPNDIVCIDPVGTYTVTTFAPPNVEAIIIGGRSADPTLSYVGVPGQTWSVPTGIDVQTGTLAIDSGATIDAGYIAVSGTLRVSASAILTTIDVDSLANFGLVEFHARSSGVIADGPVGVRNTGTIVCDWPTGWAMVGTSDWRMEGGTISGPGYLWILDLTRANSQSPVVFYWSGGTIPVSGLGPRIALVGVNLRLANTGLQGAVVVSDAPYITGDIGPGVTVYAYSDSGHGSPAASTILRSLGGGPLTNEGSLIAGPFDPKSLRGPGLINLGHVELGDATLTMDSVVNSGTMTVSGSSKMTVDAAFIRNRGTIDVVADSLLMVDAEFYSEAGSTQTGTLVMDGGTLFGEGSVGDVTSVGGRIEPRGTGVVGTLTAASVSLDAASTLGIDIAGIAPGSYDVLAVGGAVLYDGLLELREILPFVGGICGQVIPIITDASGGASRGLFSSITGLLPATTRGWRVYNPAGSFQLVGHDPSVAVSRAPSALAVSEGGIGQSYNVCLKSKPTAQVTVTAASAGGQLVLPPPVIFGTLPVGATNWALPRAVTVSAVNDLLYEPPPQIATITHSVVSADPAYNRAVVGTVAVTITDNDGSTDLGMEIQSAPPVANVGQTFTISIRNFNLGPDASVGATLTVPASAGFVYRSSSGVLSCSYDAVAGTTCQLPGPASGAFVDFTVTFEAVQVGSYPTAFTLSTIQTDPNLSNNTRTQTITIN
jgi:hypothetical protein